MSKKSEAEWNICGTYQLRHAAGVYWLLKVSPLSMQYCQPIMLNDAGAFLWRLIINQVDIDKMNQYFVQEYEIEQEEAKRDIEAFCDRLEQFGVIQKETMEI